MLRARDGKVLRWALIGGVLAVAAAVIALVAAPDRAVADVEAAQRPADASEPTASAEESPSAERVATVAPTAPIVAVEPDEPDIVAAADPQTFWGRVVDAETVAPVPGALVEVSPPTGRRTQLSAPTPVTARSDARGMFTLDLRTVPLDVAWVQAGGYSRVCISLDGFHTTAERALEITLARAGEVEGHVRDGSGAPVVGAVVRVFTSSPRLARPEGARVARLESEWTATTDWLGVARIADLPADIALDVEVNPPDAESPTRFRDFVLSRGEVRVLEWTIGAGTLITGELVSQVGRPLAKHEVWLTNALAFNWKQRASCFLDEQDGARAFAKVETDDQGRFEIAGVPRGRWWIGPAPRPRVSGVRIENQGSRRVVILREDPDFQPDLDAPCAVATQIEVDGRQPLELTLRVQCGLYITGRVLDPNGQPRSSGGVHAHGVDVGGPVNARTLGEGKFVVGPLPVGRFALWAEGVGEIADSEELYVDAGARDVELRLRASLAFAGRITGVDASASEYHAFAVNQVGIAIVPLHDDGSFEMGSMAPGKYDLVASGVDGSFGVVRGATFERGPVEIPMQRGARVRVRYEGPASEARVKAYDDGGIVAFDTVSQGTSCLLVVPPGRVRVEVRVDESSLQKRELVTAAGDEAQVDFKFD